MCCLEWLPFVNLFSILVSWGMVLGIIWEPCGDLGDTFVSWCLRVLRAGLTFVFCVLLFFRGFLGGYSGCCIERKPCARRVGHCKHHGFVSLPNKTAGDAPRKDPLGFWALDGFLTWRRRSKRFRSALSNGHRDMGSISTIRTHEFQLFVRPILSQLTAT